MHFLCGEEWKAFGEIEAHLMSEDGDGACACAVFLAMTFGKDLFN